VDVFATRQVSAGDVNFLDLRIDVSDTGIGIAPEFQKQIFEAFKQQDEQDSRKYGGTGLGLAITKRLVEMMNGEIKLKSEPGKGSTFSIKIPNVSTGLLKHTLTVQKAGERSKIRFRDLKVMVADDVDTNRELLMGIVKGENITYIEAANGIEAIDLVKQKHPDVILLDLSMPKASGFAVAEFVKNNARYRKIPIIAVSATRIVPEEKERAEYLDAFLAKPISVRELTQKMAEFLPEKVISPENRESEQIVHHEEVNVEHFLNPEKVHDTNMHTQLNELAEELNVVRESSSFNAMKSYAGKVETFSQTYGLEKLHILASEIVHASKNFDIEMMMEHLAKLSEVYKGILTKIEKGNE
jgi:two-component system sensor histidine kinase EvgS